jgi:hypothetical protein
MIISGALGWLVTLIVILAIISTSIGVFSQDDGKVYTATSIRGQTVQLYGQGLYHYDTFLIGAGNRGTDAATLFVEIPLLIVALVFYRRGSLKGGLLLIGALGWFLYYYASMSLCTAYNSLFLIYVALFSLSFFAFALGLTSFDLKVFPDIFAGRYPYRGMTIYLFVMGVVFLIVWLGLSLIPALFAGQVPTELATYTTLATYALDLGIVAPSMFLAGVLLMRRTALGYFLATVMALVNVTIGIALIGQGIAQITLQVPLAIGAIIGFMSSFAIMTLIALWLTIVVFRNVTDLAITQVRRDSR